MSEDLSAFLFLVAVLFAIFLLTAAFVVAVFVFFLRKTLSVSRKFDEQPAQRGEDFLTAAELRPWTPDAWTDLSSRWEGWWQNWTTPFREEGHAQGVVKSLGEPDGPGWIAFTVRRPQLRNGAVTLRTSQRRVELRVESSGRLDPNVRAQTQLDGAPAGSIAVEPPSCVFRGADGATEARWTFDFRWNNEVRVLNRVVSRDLYYDPIHVNGRKIADLIDTWIRYPHPESDKPIPPALQSLAMDLDDMEEGVLLIAIGMGLYYDSLRKQLRRKTDVIYDW